MDNPSRFSK
ncbi:hypothetical protein F383_38272 [Gossypium arboreum]|uniref:Uncharacterized protein n=1 Tax=Gossypium arboreum TaxID=29729 RepID=A0A0B0MHT3_GOSAR|nr:hypothetical protein F383_38272 [Gossypium arboreum]